MARTGRKQTNSGRTSAGIRRAEPDECGGAARSINTNKNVREMIPFDISLQANNK
jgi:hypothetical protein